MNSMLSHDFDPSICIRLTESLLHFLWQGAVIGLCTVLAAWISRMASSRVRYGIYATSLLLMALCVPVTIILMGAADLAPGNPTVMVGDDESIPVPPEAEPFVVLNAASPVQTMTPDSQPPMVIDEMDSGARPSTLSSSTFEENIPAVVLSKFEAIVRAYSLHAACAYLLGVIAMLGRLCCALYGGDRLRRCATPVTDRKLLKQIRSQARRIGLNVVPVVAYCDRIAIPVVAGILRPAILLPISIATSLDPEQVLVILAHEMAHIRRFDTFVNLLQRMLETVLFFHPMVWYVSHQLSVERENCCDDAVVEAGYESLQYASALLRMAELCAGNFGSIPATSLTTLAASGGSGSQLKRRIVRLIGGNHSQRPTRVDSLTLVLTVVLIVGTMAGFWRQSLAAPPDKSDVNSSVDADQAASDATSNDDRQEVEFTGSVVDLDGKSVPGADIWFVADKYEQLFADPLPPIRQVARTDEQGQFTLRLKPLKTANPTINWTHFSRLVAKSPVSGFDGMPLVMFEKKPEFSTQRDQMQQRVDRVAGVGRFASRTLRLPPTTSPVQGRLVDLEGRPVGGVKISVDHLDNPDMALLREAFEKNSLNIGEQAWGQRSVTSGLRADDWQRLIPAAISNENGEFTLHGLGRDQMATVLLSGERVAADRFFILGTEMPMASLPHSLNPQGSRNVYTGLRFTYVVSPAIPVRGVVTEFQSGKPIPNAKVFVERLFSHEGMRESSKLRLNTQHIRTVTDEQGRFQLDGIPPGNAHVIQVDPPKSEPWLIAQHEISIDPGEQSVNAEIRVFRGIWIEGQLKDEITGAPIFGNVDFLALQKNPNIPPVFGLRAGWEIGQFPTDRSGRYRVVGLPGPGVLLVRSYGATVYPLSVGAEKVDGYDAKRNYLPTTPTGMPLSNWNRIQQIDPPADAPSWTLDLTLSAGPSIQGRVLGPNDLPASDIEVHGTVEKNSFYKPLTDNKFTVHNFDSAVPRNLFFKSAKNSLVGYLRVEGTPPADLTVRLQPGVIVRGRLIETETDDVAAGYHLYCKSSNWGEFRIDDTTTEMNGRFELKGLIAGNSYKIDSSNASRFSNQKNGFTIDLTDAKPGDVIELGDVTGKRAKSSSK